MTGHGTCVYFVRAGRGPVKIGRAQNPNKRLKELQVAHYEPLKIIREFGPNECSEAAAHQEFMHAHIRGEWFRFCGEMLTWRPVAIATAVHRQSRTLLDVPIRPDYSGQIRNLETVAGKLFFDNAIPTSIQAICSRIGREEGRKYVTERQGSGVRVWRVE